MRGGLERWKRGTQSHGVRTAIAYALDGGCDAHIRVASGVASLTEYSGPATRAVIRFTVVNGSIATDGLDRDQLAAWVDGLDPLTGEQRGRAIVSPRGDLVLDGTINAPKSFSLVAMIHPELAAEFEGLQDRLRDRVIRTWQRELNARRGAGGGIREPIRQLEVVELRHRRSRALDPHIHRHLWLGVRVLGEDGQWSNVDSRVAMRLHTVINAEGELAARTDPEWIDALARHGYTLNEDGEVEQVAHAVRALSRRSTQIERNRAVLLAQWHDAHPGRQLDAAALSQIDRAAWRRGRPRKPREVNEDDWEDLIRGELVGIDPGLLDHSTPITPDATRPIDVAMLAAAAIVEADARSVATGGRLSLFDVRAGAMRAVARCGVVAYRTDLQPLIDEVITSALAMTIDLLDDDPDRPDHIKALLAVDTARLKIELATWFDELTTAGTPLESTDVAMAAETVLPTDVHMDEGQADAAAAIAGTDRLVAVTGPAGTGKTTMLKVARRCLQDQGRRMMVVAPTKKAASIARREIGTDSSSLHALLADHGWRWGRDAAGSEIWTRLRLGELDAETGIRYGGPRRYPLTVWDRVVVDEAGMVDLHTANALAHLASETGAGIAMVGDHLQARPVGHAGAMASLTLRATAVVHLSEVHRFDDPDYADLTFRLREPATRDDAIQVAAELEEHGHVRLVCDGAAARDAMVDAWFRWARQGRRVALVSGTNDEADAINEAIQQRRVDFGELTDRRIAVGMAEQRILEGDIVQTRRNDRRSGVDNRALWIVQRISDTTVELVALTDPAEFRVVSTAYVGEHLHLAYASTVHGIQGETTDASIVGPGVDAAGLYVGMTRGRTHNEAITIARNRADAIEQIADSMTRGAVEVSIDDSIRAARSELHRAARDPSPETHQATRAAQEQGLSELDEWIRSTTELLNDLASDDATRQARTHVRALDAGNDTDDALRNRLSGLLIQRIAERELTRESTSTPISALASSTNPHVEAAVEALGLGL